MSSVCCDTKIKEIVAGKKVICVKKEDKVSEVVKILKEHKIHSAVVIDSNRKPTGYVDVYDIIHHALKCQEALHKNATFESLENLLFAGKLYLSSSVSEITRNNHFQAFSIDGTLEDLLKFLQQEKRTEVALQDSNMNLVNFISLSDIASFLVKNVFRFDSRRRMECNLKELVEKEYINPKLFSVQGSTTSFADALELLCNQDIGSLAITENEGKMSGNLSPSDILAIDEDWKFRYVKLHVDDFLVFCERFKRPIVCYTTTSLEALLMEFVVKKVHNIQLVNDEMQPLGSISLKDVINSTIFAHL